MTVEQLRAMHALINEIKALGAQYKLSQLRESDIPLDPGWELTVTDQELERKARLYVAQRNSPLTPSARKARRYRRERDARGECTPRERQARWSVNSGLCYLCGRPADVMDHVIPLAKGGSNWPANLRPACWRCNFTKGARWPYDIEAHRQEKGYYDRPLLQESLPLGRTQRR